MILAQILMVVTLTLMVTGFTPLYTTAIVGSAVSALVAGFALSGKDPITLTSLVNSGLNPVIADMTGVLLFIGVMQASGFLGVIIKTIIRLGRVLGGAPGVTTAGGIAAGVIGALTGFTQPVEIRRGAASVESPRPAPEAALFTGGGLRLCYGKAVIVLDGKKSVIDMGRDGACDVVISDPRASRRHATINRRENHVVLIDESTNGTFVTIDGDSERFVKHAKITLRGKGVITFAASSAEPDADRARFECI
jgi:hypothetical protein